MSSVQTIALRNVPATALDKLKEEYLSLSELCSLFGMEQKRVRDLISLHKNNGGFMRAYKVSAGNYMFHINDVVAYIKSGSTISETLDKQE